MFQGVGRDEKKVRGGDDGTGKEQAFCLVLVHIVNFFFGILSLREGKRYSMGFNALKRSETFICLVLNFWELLAQFSRRFIVSSLFFLVLLYVYVTLQIY